MRVSPYEVEIWPSGNLTSTILRHTVVIIPNHNKLFNINFCGKLPQTITNPGISGIESEKKTDTNSASKINRDLRDLDFRRSWTFGAYGVVCHWSSAKMTWTQSIADSLGVADEGLRLILGQLSGKPILFSNQVFYFRSDIFSKSLSSKTRHWNLEMNVFDFFGFFSMTRLISN